MRRSPPIWAEKKAVAYGQVKYIDSVYKFICVSHIYIVLFLPIPLYHRMFAAHKY